MWRCIFAELPLADSPGCAVAMSAREVMSASSILGRTRRLLFLCAPFLSASLPPPPFAIVQPFKSVAFLFLFGLPPTFLDVWFRWRLGSSLVIPV